MKTTTTAVAVLLTAMCMTACAKKESEAPAEAAPATTAAPAEAPAATSMAPAEAAPAATPPNDEDTSQTSGDKVSPKP